MKKKIVRIEKLKDFNDGTKKGSIEKWNLKDALLWEKKGMIKILDKEVKEEKKPIKKPKKEVIKEKPKKLSDKQVMNKLKEIAKLENPLDVNNQIKDLSQQSNHNSQILRKQLNYIRKSIDKNSDISDTDDIDDIDDTMLQIKEIKACVSLVTCNKDFLQAIFGDSTLEQIMKNLLLSKKALTFGELAIKTGKSEANIRNTISRNKVYFGAKRPNGKICYTYLLQMALDEFKVRIDHLKQVEDQKKKAELEFRQQQLNEENTTQEIKNFIFSTKSKREGMFINLDFKQILEFSPKLADFFLDEPERFLKEFSNHYGDSFNVQLLNIPETYSLNIEEIRKENLGKIICVDGRITSFGEVKPIITEINFECPSCGSITKVKQNYRIGNLEEPKKCSCGRRGGFRVLLKKEVNACFLQLEDLQSKTDNPHSQRIKSVLFNEMCEYNKIKIFNPGNEIRCIGILKEVPIFKGNRKTIFLNWILEIMSAELIEKDIDVTSFSDEEVEEMNTLSQMIDSEGIDYLMDSFCPEVYGYEEIKGAMILQACNRRNAKVSKSVRNKSNILMIGDPGIAKSILGNFALQVSTGGRKAVGGGSSAVGLTASVVKEDDSLGGYRVEPGAMILAKDLLFIDEMNNLSEDDKPKLQEGMNEQTISINKANLHVQMKVTCGIMAAANPVYGSFKEGDKLTIQEQFNIPSPILNRFDSIFVMTDYVDEKMDEQVANKMLKRHIGTLDPKYDKDFLRMFFAYIRNTEEPEIDETAQRLLKEVYSKARKTYNAGVKINPRFLEALTRMSISSAKIRQDIIIKDKDIKIALTILSKSQYKINEELLL